MSNSTIAVALRRSPYSPDLWIPYVLIGSSCVTFLAVHFWCYHKRNRERYLRQREEKQLKFGLMERRRIATLIIERYQSELGTNQSNTDMDLPQTHCDNSMECVGGEQKDGDHNQQSCSHDIKSDTSMYATTDMAVGAEANPSNSLEYYPKTSAAKGLPNSRSWPRIPDSKSLADNASTKCRQKIKPVHLIGARQSTFSTITNAENLTVNKCETLADVTNTQTVTGSRLTLLQGSSTSTSTDRARAVRKPPEMASRNIKVPRQQTISRPFPPPTYRSRVFYTDISSATQYSRTSSFNSKHSKRRYDGTSIQERQAFSADKDRANGRAFNRWTNSRPQESEKVLLTSFYNYGEGKASENYGYSNSDAENFTQTTKPTSSFGCRGRETFYSTHADQLAADADQHIHPFTVVHQDGRETEDGSLYALNKNTGNTRMHHKPSFIRQEDAETNVDDGANADEINSQTFTYAHNYFSRHDHGAAADMSCSAMASVTSGEHDSSVDIAPSPQVYLPSSHVTPLIEVRKSNIFQSSSKTQPETLPTNGLGSRPAIRPEARPTEQTNLPSICGSVSFLVDQSLSSGSRPARWEPAHDVPETDSGNISRKPPRLRVLDPKLIFNYSHRHPSAQHHSETSQTWSSESKLGI